MNTQVLKNEGMTVQMKDGEWTVYWSGEPILSHRVSDPLLYVGIGKEKVEMYRGNFQIEDYLLERIPLRYSQVKEVGAGYCIDFYMHIDEEPVMTYLLKVTDEKIHLQLLKSNETYNRYWIRIEASKDEKVYGCGEQMSHFNLRGKNFPLWTSEPGVGRNKNTYVTWQADVKDKAGGDYYHTNYPQPTFVSSKKYFLHVDTTAYADFDFRHDDFHELQIWAEPKNIMIEGASSFLELVQKVSAFFGRQPELPEWTYNGMWLAIQGGTETVQQKLDLAKSYGIKVGAVWCQDWQGERITSFGKRLMWNWKWNRELYPNLDNKLKEWKEQGVRFLGYINPYVAVEGDLFKEAEEKGYLALNNQGETYLVDFGEFDCGVVDFTNPAATEWYKQVIKEHLISFGLDGWMADFGEYLPTDVTLKNGKSPMLMHNAWPELWAKTNFEAVKEAGKLGEVVYFMRAGYSGFQKYCTLLWAGDQSVDWSLDDGLASVIPAALSSGMSGMGLHHSDIGGYTSLHGMKRSKELLLRWTDLNTFTPVMRSHEGNRPYDCFQFDGDEETLKHFARMTNIYVDLAPYTKMLVKENAEKGIPVQRPLFMHYEDDPKTYEIQYQYLYGRDILVAPVYHEGVKEWNVYLPEDEWIHLWTGQSFSKGNIRISAEIGYPPVFVRKGSSWIELFEKIRHKYGE